jgi:hypothetical protein
MENVTKINADLDWPTWVARWDRIQACYIHLSSFCTRHSYCHVETN